MNWYKKAKLLDKTPLADSSIFSACMYCKRWATEPDEGGETSWKKHHELSPSEKEEARNAEEAMKSDYFTEIDKSGISHGICPYCDTVLESIGGWPSSQEDIQYVTDKSLELT